MNLSIRYATKDDALLIADMSRQTFVDTFAAYNTAADMKKFLDEQFTRGRLILEVGAPEHIFMIAYADNEVAGYFKLRKGYAPVELKAYPAIELARIYVVKSMIGTGVGKLLMQTALNVAREKNKELIWLGVWEKNQRAIDFYTNWGFEKFGETDFLLGNDVQRDWLMMKKLV